MNQIRLYRKEIEEKDLKIQELRAQIEVELTLQDATNNRESSISESYQT